MEHHHSTGKYDYERGHDHDHGDHYDHRFGEDGDDDEYCWGS